MIKLIGLQMENIKININITTEQRIYLVNVSL